MYVVHDPGGSASANQSEATRFDRRDILRATVFLWSTPLPTPRCISGCAAFRATFAAAASPLVRKKNHSAVVKKIVTEEGQHSPAVHVLFQMAVRNREMFYSTRYV